MKQDFIIISPSGWAIMAFSVSCTVTICFSKYQQVCTSNDYDATQQEVAIKYLKKKQISKVEKILGKGCEYSTTDGQQVIIWNSSEVNNQIRVLVRDGKVIKFNFKKNDK